MKRYKYILGAGLTGLACGYRSGLSIFEAESDPGGLCTSYYFRPGETKRLTRHPNDQERYRFEIGGGHWIFGAGDNLLRFINKFVEILKYNRLSSIYFHKNKLYVPYPLQYNLSYLDKNIASRTINEIQGNRLNFRTMKDWLIEHFGQTLCELFFFPFHQLYTADLYDRIAPQDAYKSPVDITLVMQGVRKDVKPVGYNTTFIYPKNGLNDLAHKISSYCDVRFNKRVIKIDIKDQILFFEDSSQVPYDSIISTLPLNKAIEMTGINIPYEQDPYTSVLVLNIGATRGQQCPDDHWIYTPRSESGFHRVGFYSNVDTSFLPISSRKNQNTVSIYVEKAFPGGEKPVDKEINRYAAHTVKELQGWDFIGSVDVIDPTWIDVAYTWSWPKSPWRRLALAELKKNDIHQAGRYGRWKFQGIADSINDGMLISSSINNSLS